MPRTSSRCRPQKSAICSNVSEVCSTSQTAVALGIRGSAISLHREGGTDRGRHAPGIPPTRSPQVGPALYIGHGAAGQTLMATGRAGSSGRRSGGLETMAAERPMNPCGPKGPGVDASESSPLVTVASDEMVAPEIARSKRVSTGSAELIATPGAALGVHGGQRVGLDVQGHGASTRRMHGSRVEPH